MSLRELYDRAKAAGIPLGRWSLSQPRGDYLRKDGERNDDEQEAADALDRMCREAMKTMLPGFWLDYEPRREDGQQWAARSYQEIEYGHSQAAAIISAIEARKGETL